jgi:hypothetical protein
MIPLIFVFNGILPNYCFYSLEFAKKYSNKKIILLISKNNTNIPKDVDYYYIEDFYKENLLQKINFAIYYKNFWNGFWIKAIERFFILKVFCKKKNITSFFHAEFDNIIFNLDSLDKKLNHFGKKFFFTKDMHDRGLAGLVYINSIDILSNFCNFVLKNLQINFLNDMQLLGKFSNIYPEKCIILPNELHAFRSDKISIKSIDDKIINGIVDGARIGSFLFGTDPRLLKVPVFNRIQPVGDCNTNNFNYNNLLFYLSKSKKEFKIKHRITKKIVRIYNLHVHSKLFKKLSNEKFFFSVLYKINLNQRTLLTLNLKNIFRFAIIDLKLKFSKFFFIKK